MLQQALGLFGENTFLVDLRKQIEGNFEIIKTALIPKEEHEEVRLSSSHAQWYVALDFGCGCLCPSGFMMHLITPQTMNLTPVPRKT